MAGVAEADCADYPTGVFSKYAVWDGKVENYVRWVAGDAFDELAQAASEKFDISPGECLKFPTSGSAILIPLVEQGVKFPTLESIVKAIDQLILES